MTPAEAAREVVTDLRLELSLTQDHIETIALTTTIKALDRFARLIDSRRCHKCSGLEGEIVQVKPSPGLYMHAYGMCHTNGSLEKP